MTIRDQAVVVPNHAADDDIAQQVRTHHAAMVAELGQLVMALHHAGQAKQEQARQRVSTWFETVLVPHADEEERTTYRAAGELPEGRLLIEAMVREHALIKRLVALFGEADAPAAEAYGRAVLEAFESHQGKENDIILPLLLEAPQVSLAKVMGGADGHQIGDSAHRHDHH